MYILLAWQSSYHSILACVSPRVRAASVSQPFCNLHGWKSGSRPRLSHPPSPTRKSSLRSAHPFLHQQASSRSPPEESGGGLLDLLAIHDRCVRTASSLELVLVNQRALCVDKTTVYQPARTMREAVSPCDHAGAIGRAQTRLSCPRFRSLTASIEGEENWMNVSLSGNSHLYATSVAPIRLQADEN